MGNLEQISEFKAELGEGPVWDHYNNVLYWVDIEGEKLLKYNPDTSEEKIFHIGIRTGAAVLIKSGTLLLATETGFYEWEEKTERLTFISDPEEKKDGNRFNDGKVDPHGRFWAGTMSLHGESGTGSLYRLNHDYSIETVKTNVTISNGLAWVPDGSKMYYIDTPTKKVQVFDLNRDTGEIVNEATAFHVPENEGRPDGMTIDEEGMLWIAHFNGSQVARWNPATGEKMDSIQMPVSLCTSCTFGGPERKDLYITTAKMIFSEEERRMQPEAGGLFRISLDIKGAPSYTFKKS
ncbi:SMP-30/gluconolactonase/LRE family protein [Alteribacillus sp. HJP-4]|uniref:SMP-30/gluconolactonase/LRE family protein n=1 Tax=Alteribacillus sp. HJP-4 TaxID=2775394 RepID=UPI0035CCE72B